MSRLLALGVCTVLLASNFANCTQANDSWKLNSKVIKSNKEKHQSTNTIATLSPTAGSQSQLISPLESMKATPIIANGDLHQEASTQLPISYSSSINQPSVYHSIIDRSNGALNHFASPAIQASTSTDGDLNTAAGHHHGHHAHGKYYEYRAVPKKKTWKFGYKRGNHKHTISRHEHGKAGKHPHFTTKVKWHDKKSKGKGIHLWDYNHHDKKHYGHHHG